MWYYTVCSKKFYKVPALQKLGNSEKLSLIGVVFTSTVKRKLVYKIVVLIIFLIISSDSHKKPLFKSQCEIKV